MDDFTVAKAPEVKKLLESVKPLAYSVRGFAAASNLSPSTIYEVVKSGKLKSRRCNDKIVILPDDGMEYLHGLPEYEINKKRQ